MKVELPIEQWNALAEAAKRNAELLQLALTNIDTAARALAAEEAKSCRERKKKL